MPFEGLENRVLCYALHTGKAKLLFSRLTENHFTGVNKEIYNYLSEHWGRHGAAPSVQLVSEKFEEFGVKAKCKAREFPVLVEELVERRKLSQLAETIRESSKQLAKAATSRGDVSDILNYIEQSCQEVRELGGVPNRFRLRANALSFWQEDYEKILSQDGMLGLRTNIAAVDKVTHGFKKGELIAILGFTGEGKTYLSLLLAGKLWEAGSNPAIFSLEMEAETVARRMYVVLSGLTIEDYLSGTLRTSELTLMKKTMRRVSRWKAEAVIDDDPMLNVASLRAKLREYEPDIAIIDYLGLMTGSERIKNPNERLDTLVRQLKIAAREFEIPIILNVQATRDAAGSKKPPTLSQVAGGMPLAKTADTIMAFVRSGPRYTVTFRKNRNAGTQPTVRLVWSAGAQGLKCESQIVTDYTEDI